MPTIARHAIPTNLDKVRAFADGVLFEFGPSREKDLALRNRIRQWQPNLRILFILRIVLWRYRVRLPGFELPEALQPAQAEFDNRFAMGLGAKGRFNGRVCPPRTGGMEGLDERTRPADANDKVVSPPVS